MTPEDVRVAFWSLVVRFVPIHLWKQSVWVSPEAIPYIPQSFAAVTFVDVKLSGLEMRFEDWR